MSSSEQQVAQGQGWFDGSLRTLLRVPLVGALAGAFVYGLSLLIERYVPEQFFCGQQTAQICDNSAAIAFNGATTLVALLATIALVRISTYRPLLITVAAAAALWGVHVWLGALVWYEMLVWLVVLYALLYTLLAWLLRVYSIVLAAILVIVIVVLARLVVSF